MTISPGNLVYPESKTTGKFGPLSRFLPPIPDGVALNLLQAQTPSLPSGTWILDPFGASPRTAVELARSGYRVLIAANNPVARFLIEMAAHPPLETEFRAALADLATARKGDERIEPHLRALYATDCSRCGRTIMAEAFLWERDASAPYGRIYSCSYCGDNGEHPITPADVHRATIAIAGLHRTRALERVAPLHDPDRANAEEAIAVYPLRAVYALFTLINKLDGLALSPLRRRCLEALLLSTCDQANTLWAYPTTRERPRHLSVPPRYRENNVWQALEDSIALWITHEPVVPLVTWPNQLEPETNRLGGICIYEGRLRDLISNLSDLSIGAVVATLPRPNQAFWTLSALWAGWLWGREAVGPFKSVLRRRRYDWAWHTTALTSALKALVEYLPTGIPFVGLIGEAEYGFLNAATIAADLAGFDLQGMTLRDENNPAYFLWQRGDPAKSYSEQGTTGPLVQEAISSFMKELGEPTDYLHLSAASIINLCALHIFRKPSQSLASAEKTEDHPANLFSQAQNTIREVLTVHGGFLRYSTAETFEIGHWWLREVKGQITPLSDRIEMEIVNYLIEHPGCNQAQITRRLCETFPGLFTPGIDIIQICLDSYGSQNPPESGDWYLRPADTPGNRQSEMDVIRGQIYALAERLGFMAQGDSPIVWLDELNQAQYWYFIKTSGIFSDIVLNTGLPPGRTLIVLPGSRANLVVFKQRKDPRLAQIMQAGWRFLKFRHLRWLLETQILTRGSFDEQLNADPLTYTTTQQRLF